MDLSSITLPPLFIITDKLLQLQTSLLLFYLIPLRWIHLHQMTDKEIIPLMFAKIFPHCMMRSGNHDQFKIFIRLINALTTCMVEAGSTLSSSSPTTNIKGRLNRCAFSTLDPSLY